MIDRDDRVPDVGRLIDDGRRNRVVVGDAELVVEVVELDQFPVGVFVGLVGGVLRTQLVKLLAQFGILALGFQGAAEPPEQISNGLQRLVGAILDRRDNGQEAALHRVQATARGLPEVGGQQYQGEHDEQCEHRTSAPNRLLIHELGPSEAFIGKSTRVLCGPAADTQWRRQRAGQGRRTTHRRRRAAGSRRARSSTAATARVAVGAVDRLELLERAPRPDRHARQRRLRQVRGHLCLLAQALIEAL